MQLIRASAYRRMPWKNGGGETAEIAVFPPQSALDAFDWRISMAHVESDGPFSSFANVDRSLAIVAGVGLRLNIDGREPIELTPASAPVAFPADVPTTVALLAGAITDLNVMSRRGRFTHRLRRMELPGVRPIERTARSTFLICAGGSLRAESGTERLALAPGDTLACGEAGPAIVVTPEGAASLFIVELTSC